jgi:predicted AAA+ superfamily ATPase
MYERILHIPLPSHRSVFLWGARQTGKSTFLKKNFKNSLYIDLLKTDELIRYTRSPSLLREEILALTAPEIKHPIVIDEIQKVPSLLNEIHWLIESTPAQFILCGSSARQLKTASTNLLGGRAGVCLFLPLVYAEVPDFNLLKALQQGLIPNHYQAKSAGKSFEHYVFMELKAYQAYLRKKVDITYWRTKSGLEVDFIIGEALVAIEVKLSEQVHKEDLKGLIAFLEEHPDSKAIVVSRDKRERKLLLANDQLITIFPWEKFLNALWAGTIF